MWTGERDDVLVPLYGQEYKFPIYKVVIGENEYKFVAGAIVFSVFIFKSIRVLFYKILYLESSN